MFMNNGGNAVGFVYDSKEKSYLRNWNKEKRALGGNRW